MNCIKYIFLVSSLGLSAAVPMQYGSFDNDLKIGGISPIAAKNVKLVPGVKGQAVRIEKNGQLKYPMDSNVLKNDQGTIMFWFQQDQTPWGGKVFRDRDADENGIWTGKLHSSSRLRSLFKSGSIGIGGGTYCSWGAAGAFGVYPWIRQIFGGEWHFIALTYRKGEYRLYFDGYSVSIKKPKILAEQKFWKFFLLGTGNSGLEGAIDEFKTFDHALSADEILAEYASICPFTLELMDYSVTAGEEKNLRFRIRNLTSRSLDRTLKINGREIRVSVPSKDLREFTVPVKREKPGIFQLAVNDESAWSQKFELIALSGEKEKILVSNAPAKKTLLQKIDCTKPLKSGEANDTGSHVIDGYREVDTNATGSGFLYRLTTPYPGKAHWLEVDYPDIGKREYIVGIFYENYGRFFTKTLDCMGIITGMEHRSTRKIQTKGMVFWPDSKNFSAAIFGYRPLKGSLPPAAAALRLYVIDGEMPTADVPQGGRTVSNWDEDPTMDADLAFSNLINSKSADLEFWRVKWTRIIEYMRYMGMNEWSIKAMSYYGDVTGMTATLEHKSSITSLEGRVPGWAELGADMLDRAGMNIMLRLNNKAFIGNWFAALGELKNPDDLCWIDNNGSKYIQSSYEFNFMRPEARTAMKRIIAAYRDKFKVYKHFRGISLNEHPTLCFGSLNNGYGDWTISQFTKDTGIEVPEKTASGRYQWLMKNAKEQWIDWRCRKVAEVVKELADTLRAGGNDKLELQFWVRGSFMEDNGLWPEFDYDRNLREAGIDLALLTKIPGVNAVPCIRPDYSRVWGKLGSNEPYLIYSKEISDFYRKNRISAINIFRHSNLEIYPSLAKAQKWKFPWWAPIGLNVQGRADFTSYATPYPNTQFVLEPLAHLVAEFDIKDLEHGWWGIPEQGHNDLFRKFYTQFRQIPREDFDLIPGDNDPVAVRVGKSGYYMVNREGCPVQISYRLNGALKERSLEGGEIYYEKTARQPEITDVKTEVPKEEKDYYNAELARLKLICKASPDQPNMKMILSKFESAVKGGRYSEARRWLLTMPARAARMKKSVPVSPYFDREKNAVVLSITNFGVNTYHGTVRLSRLPSGMKAGSGRLQLQIPPGESFQAVLPVTGPVRKLRASDVFTVELSENGSFEELRYNFPPIDAVEIKPGRPVEFSGSMSVNDTEIRRPILKRIGNRKYKINYAVQYDGDGLRVYVEAEDPHYFQPQQRGQMFLRDCIQIYIDQKNDSQCNAAPGYDDNDVVFQFGELNGKPELFMETPYRQVVPAKGSVTRKDGITIYDVIIPKSVLPECKLQRGNVIGFSLLVNQHEADSQGEFHISFDTGRQSYRHPSNWLDCYFK